MKKYLFILFFVLFPSTVFAATDTFEGQAITSTTNIEGCTACDTIEGQVKTASGLAVENVWKGTDDVSSPLNVTVAPSVGNLLVVAIFSRNDGGSHTVSDNIDGTTGWVNAVEYGCYGTHNAAIWYKANIPSGITDIAITCNDVGGYGTGAVIHEVSGASTSTPFTGGEATSWNDGGTKTTNPQTVTKENATADSIYFALVGLVAESATYTNSINGTGSVGTWISYSSDSYYTGWDGSAGQDMNVVYQIVSTSASRIHGWSTDQWYSVALLAIFH